jgi:hypothetical protein
MSGWILNEGRHRDEQDHGDDNRVRGECVEEVSEACRQETRTNIRSAVKPLSQPVSEAKE